MATIIEYNPKHDQRLLTQCRDLQIACVLTDHTLMRFLPPFTDEKKRRMDKFYADCHAEVEAASRRIFLCVEDSEARGDEPTVTGMVMLHKPGTETGPFRSDVELLAVSPERRKRGIAKLLMIKLEEAGCFTG